MNVPGASRVFKGGIIAYDNEIKEHLLGVSKETLRKHGAVSLQCVEEMLKGTLDAFKVNWALAISGIAGPEGGTPEKPVGTVIIGVASNNGEKDVRGYLFSGERNTVRRKSVMTALNLLRRMLMGGMRDDER